MELGGARPGRQGQENLKLQASLVYIMNLHRETPCQKHGKELNWVWEQGVESQRKKGNGRGRAELLGSEGEGGLDRAEIGTFIRGVALGQRPLPSMVIQPFKEYLFRRPVCLALCWPSDDTKVEVRLILNL